MAWQNTLWKFFHDIYGAISLKKNRIFRFPMETATPFQETDIKIGIIDDQMLFAESLKELISSFEFVSSTEILPCPTANIYRPPFSRFDLILVDVNMPFMDGFAVLSKIREFHPKQKFALLTVREDRLSMEDASKLEVQGYLFKSSSKEQLEEAILTILEGKVYYQEKPKTEKKSFTFEDGTKIILTSREQDFLQLLLLELTTKEIANQMHISEHTVIGYRKSLFQKFNVLNMVGLAKYAVQIFK